MKKSPHILTRKSRPEAVLLPYDEYLRLAALSTSEITERFSKVIARMQVVNAQYNDEEIEHDLREATKVVRKAK